MIEVSSDITGKERAYILEDRDALLIKAIKDLTNAINKLREKH